MIKGHEVHFTDESGKTRIYKVGIADQDAAMKAARGGRTVTNMFILPLKDGDYERLGLTEGQVLESTQI